MRPVDKLVAAYLTFTTLLIISRWEFSAIETWLLLVMHALVAALLYLFTRLEDDSRVGAVIYELYPLLLLSTLYTELGVLSMLRGLHDTFARDAVIQRWEAVIFGSQISYEWIRNFPSVFWSGILHLAYMLYYPMVLAGPLLLLIRRRTHNAQNVLFTTILAFILCYVVFALYPVAGPNYTFGHPTGPVRDVWSARLVYSMLGTGSAFGTAFPSSHVAATVATNFSLWREWRTLALITLVPTVLLVIGTVYCQMHYGLDAAVGLLVGLAAGWVGIIVARRNQPNPEVTT
jgi:membrane-associated phospholipid phosphatase